MTASHSGVLHLFAGMGGSHLALGELMGLPSVGSVENSRNCQRVLRQHYPDEPIHDDVRTFDGEAMRGRVTLVAMGFPCTNLSPAGQRQGIEGGSASSLFYEGLRIAAESEAPLLFIENVAGFLTAPANAPPKGNKKRGEPMSAEERSQRKAYLDAHRGESFDVALRALQQRGYGTIRWTSNRACDPGIDAPHKRERVWLLAQYTGSTASGAWTRPKAWPVKGIVDGNTLTSLQQRLPPVTREDTWPTPDATQQKKATPASRQEGIWKAAFLASGRVWQSGVRGQGHVNPRWLEALMGWPLGWTAGERSGEWPAQEGLWPMGRGLAQHEWEPPRLVVDEDRLRAGRVKALGNAWVPAQAVAALDELLSP